VVTDVNPTVIALHDEVHRLGRALADRDAEIERLKARPCNGVKLAHHRLATRIEGDWPERFDREFAELGLPACGETDPQDVADFDATVANLRNRYDLAKTFGDTRHAELQELHAIGAAILAMIAEAIGPDWRADPEAPQCVLDLAAALEKP
jgi:hypothetical protein